MYINLFFYICFSDPPKVRLSLGSSIDPDAISEGNDVYMDCEIRANPRVYKVEWSHNVSFTIIWMKSFPGNSWLCRDNLFAKLYNSLYLGSLS